MRALFSSATGGLLVPQFVSTFVKDTCVDASERVASGATFGAPFSQCREKGYVHKFSAVEPDSFSTVPLRYSGKSSVEVFATFYVEMRIFSHF